MKPSAKPYARLERLVVIEILLTLLVILGGAFVRASGSGAGCGEHWPLCNGQAIPLNPRIETIVEFTHRLTSGASLLVFVAIFFLLRKRLPKKHAARAWSQVALVSFFLEAAIGAFLVLKKLVTTDTSILRAVVIALHLVNTYVLLAGLVGILWNLRKERSLFPGEIRGKWLVLLTGWGVVGALGAIVALGDTLFPASSLAHGISQDLDPLSHPLVRLRAFHPIIAILVSVYSLMATIPKTGEPRSSAALWVRSLITAQVICGILNWLLLAPTVLQITHLLLADLAWLAMIWLTLDSSSRTAKRYQVPTGS